MSEIRGITEGEYWIGRLAAVLAEVYEPAGVLIYIAASNKLIGRSPAEAIRERDVAQLQTLVRHVNAAADGNFA